MGLKLSLVLFVIMAAMGGAGYWYYNDTQERMAILNENNAKLEQAVETNEAALKAQREAFESMAVENERLQKQFTEIRDRKPTQRSQGGKIDLPGLSNC